MVNACVRCFVCCLTKGGSRCCGIFSFIGCVFLISLGIILTFQSEFIHLPYEANNLSQSEAAEIARDNAYAGAIIYAVVVCLCGASYWKHTQNEHLYQLAQRPSLNGVELESFEDMNVPLMPEDGQSTSTSVSHRNLQLS
uniref:Uncharacterized protein n=1 Tax=Aplanochytrium stocchinoi TaxID=215587 RepID=A0A7S3PRQ7_9STRA|mmetsp:Transcript_12282/g.15245  ORF Transcript_12282/g.15245 Transcript_12282/m.15245 type:complete len:140 (+) Transcript_12282:290-709(+)